MSIVKIQRNTLNSVCEFISLDFLPLDSLMSQKLPMPDISRYATHHVEGMHHGSGRKESSKRRRWGQSVLSKRSDVIFEVDEEQEWLDSEILEVKVHVRSLAELRFHIVNGLSSLCNVIGNLENLFIEEERIENDDIRKLIYSGPPENRIDVVLMVNLTF